MPLGTLHALSGGRLEVGLGAGYNPLDYSRSGIVMPDPGERVTNLIEHTALLRAVFAAKGEPVTVHGVKVHADDLPTAQVEPTLAAPRLLIGGGGKRVLTHAARHADIVLPSANQLERNDITASRRENFLAVSHKLFDPPLGLIEQTVALLEQPHAGLVLFQRIGEPKLAIFQRTDNLLQLDHRGLEGRRGRCVG